MQLIHPGRLAGLSASDLMESVECKLQLTVVETGYCGLWNWMELVPLVFGYPKLCRAVILKHSSFGLDAS